MAVLLRAFLPQACAADRNGADVSRNVTTRTAVSIDAVLIDGATPPQIEWQRDIFAVD